MTFDEINQKFWKLRSAVLNFEREKHGIRRQFDPEALIHDLLCDAHDEFCDKYDSSASNLNPATPEQKGETKDVDSTDGR